MYLENVTTVSKMGARKRLSDRSEKKIAVAKTLSEPSDSVTSVHPRELVGYFYSNVRYRNQEEDVVSDLQ